MCATSNPKIGIAGVAAPEDEIPIATGPSPLIEEGGLSPEAVASLDRLLASELIVRAPRIRVVLKFFVDALREGRAHNLREQDIGQAVFGRPAGYNPGEDNIVRVTMRHLRERVDQYYRTEGRNERYVLSIPKGKYLPTLILHPEEPAETVPDPSSDEPTSAPAPQDATTAEPDQSAPARRLRFAALLPWLLVAALTATVIALDLRPAKQVGRSAPSSKPGLLSLLLENGKQTRLIVIDSNLKVYRMLFGKTVPLDSYLTRSYENDASPSKDTVIAEAWKRFLLLSSQTSVSSSIVAAQIQAAASPTLIRVEQPDELSMRNFQHDNFILLGGPWVNPWDQLFEEKLNFRIAFPQNNTSVSPIVQNLNPLPGEKQEYASHQRANGLTVNYVRIALLRNLSNDGYVMVLGGATGEGAIEAAARFVTNPQQVTELLRTFHAKSLQDLPPFEAVIEVTSVQHVPEEAHIVAERAIKPQ